MGSGKKSLPLKLRLFVYLSHTLSSWGDRMWSFGVGLFMVIISPESLRVTALYGLANNVAILLFGAIVGDWVDKTPRLKAARTTLIIQNSSVLACAVCLFLVIQYKAEIGSTGGMLELCYVGIIFIAIVSNLASMGTSLAIQRDWVVEICGRDKDMLASTTAVMRRIDLTTKLVAPIATGQIMYFASPGIGALFIAGWNLASVFAEYILLWKVYSLVPALRSKKKGYIKEAVITETHDAGNNVEPGIEIEMEVYVDKPDTDADTEDMPLKDHSDTTDAAGVAVATEETGRGDTASEPGCFSQCCTLMFSGVTTLLRGWTTFMKYDVAFAGIGLSALYMTVLGFDNITVGYAYSQGVNESIMGALMAAGALTGIFGTFLYPIIRKRIGLERTGLFGFFFEICFLCLCVASIWSPGSPFDPTFSGNNQPITCNLTTTGSDVNLTGLPTSSLILVNNSGVTPVYDIASVNQSAGFTSLNETTTMTAGACDVPKSWESYISVALLMAGIIGARCGLWMADLTITQLFLENVKETERGIVSGTQNSLNKFMDLLKYIMVVVAPQPEVFGILILVSFVFIWLGWLSYAKFSHQARGHLFHLEKFGACKCSDVRNNNRALAVQVGTQDKTGQ